MNMASVDAIKEDFGDKILVTAKALRRSGMPSVHVSCEMDNGFVASATCCGRCYCASICATGAHHIPRMNSCTGDTDHGPLGQQAVGIGTF